MMAVNVTELNNATTVSTNGTTTIIPTTGISPPTLYIILGVLAGTIVLLSIILAIIFCRRNSQKKVFGSTLESVAAQSNLSFEDEVEHDEDPIYRPSPDHTDSTMEYVDINGGSQVNPNGLQTNGNDRDSAYTDIEANHTPPRQSILSQNSDYENAGSIVYENCNRGEKNKLSPAPLSSSYRVELPTVPERKALDKEKSSGNLFRHGTKAYHLYSNALQDYEVEATDLSMTAKIGKGHFSTVYSGVAARLPYTHEKNKTVAIKTMKSSASDSDKHEFLYEFEVMKLTNSLHHKNITKLLASVTRTNPYMLVLELMPNGNLRNFLRATRSQDIYYNLHGNSNSLSERQLLQFALDIAKGMEGIADLQLLHRDLAARNILLSANMTCKISDFGFAKDVLNKAEYKSKSLLHRARPVRWLAPESVLLFKHSILSDVWSYGIVLWEIVTLGNLPYPDLKVQEVQQALSKGYRMGCPTHCSPDLYRVMACCWEEDSQMRPPFPQLVDKMRKLLGDATRMIDMGRIEEDDYIDVLPSDEAELFTDFPETDSVC